MDSNVVFLCCFGVYGGGCGCGGGGGLVVDGIGGAASPPERLRSGGKGSILAWSLEGGGARTGRWEAV